MIKETHESCSVCEGYGSNSWGTRCEHCKGKGIILRREGIPNGRMEFVISPGFKLKPCRH